MVSKATRAGTRADKRELRKRLDRLSHEIAELKAALVYQSATDRGRAALAWRDLLKVSDEISVKWSGPSAVEEIRAQREK